MTQRVVLNNSENSRLVIVRAGTNYYTFFEKGTDKITLDGDFTIDDLTAIIAEMQKYLPPQEV